MAYLKRDKLSFAIVFKKLRLQWNEVADSTEII